jgi:hypothetical protein
MDPLLRKSRRMMKRKNGHSWPYSHNRLLSSIVPNWFMASQLWQTGYTAFWHVTNQFK